MLDQDLKGQYSSAVGLDNDRLLLVHDRDLVRYPIEGRGTKATQGIEVAEMVRNPAAPQTTPRIIPVNQRDDWVFDHSFRSSFDYFGGITVAPDGTLFTIHEKGVNSGEFSASRTIHVSYDMARTFEPVAQLPAGATGVSSYFDLAAGFVRNHDGTKKGTNGTALRHITPVRMVTFTRNGLESRERMSLSRSGPTIRARLGRRPNTTRARCFGPSGLTHLKIPTAR